jgi:hypothetical protein
VLEDFEALDYSRQTALERVPSTTARHWWARSITGFSTCTRWRSSGTSRSSRGPPDEGQLMKIVERTKLPAAAFSTLVRHAGLDPYHRDGSIAW